MRCCAFFVCLFTLVATVGLAVSLFTNLATGNIKIQVIRTDDEKPLSLPTENITTENYIKHISLSVEEATTNVTPSYSATTLAAASSNSSTPSAPLNTVSVLAQTRVQMWSYTYTYSSPDELGETITMSGSTLDYFPCSEGKNVLQGFIVSIILSIALSFTNSIVSAVQIFIKKSVILRVPIIWFVSLGGLICLAPAALLLVLFFSSFCGLDSVQRLGFAPQIGFFSICIATALNILSTIFVAWM